MAQPEAEVVATSDPTAPLLSAELYLRAHPELTSLLTDFTSAALQSRPDDVVAFAVHFFAQLPPTPRTTSSRPTSAGTTRPPASLSPLPLQTLLSQPPPSSFSEEAPQTLSEQPALPVEAVAIAQH